VFERTKDRISEWLRYPQPNWLQKRLIGLWTDSIDLDFTARRLAAEESAQYMVQHMRQARNFKTDYDLHEWVIDQIEPDLLSRGLILEFGVATGRTLNHFGRLVPNKMIYGFDGFQGLPEDWTWYIRRGHFQQPLPRVRSNCRLVVGWFDDTLPGFLTQYPSEPPVAFLHIDCDLYSSTDYVLKQLASRIVPGTVIVFDEYFNFPGWQQDEFCAWQEFVKRENIRYEYIGMVTRHQKVAVRILG
jgi:hypothetical protein